MTVESPKNNIKYAYTIQEYIPGWAKLDVVVQKYISTWGTVLDILQDLALSARSVVWPTDAPRDTLVQSLKDLGLTPSVAATDAELRLFLRKKWDLIPYQGTIQGIKNALSLLGVDPTTVYMYVPDIYSTPPYQVSRVPSAPYGSNPVWIVFSDPRFDGQTFIPFGTTYQYGSSNVSYGFTSPFYNRLFRMLVETVVMMKDDSCIIDEVIMIANGSVGFADLEPFGGSIVHYWPVNQ